MKTIELASAVRVIVSVMVKRLRKTAQSAENFSLTELGTLSHLYPDHSLSTTELATLAMVKSQSMSELLSKFQIMGIVDKIPSVTDKRKSLIHLTDQGKKIVEITRYERDEWLAHAIDHSLTKEEKLILEKAMALMAKISEFK